MTTYEYISVMERSAVSALPSFHLKYINDNAPIHRTILVKRWKEDNEAEEMDWPPYSLGLHQNPSPETTYSSAKSGLVLFSYSQKEGVNKEP
jgi:hypothetical protein